MGRKAKEGMDRTGWSHERQSRWEHGGCVGERVRGEHRLTGGEEAREGEGAEARAREGVGGRHSPVEEDEEAMTSSMEDKRVSRSSSSLPLPEHLSPFRLREEEATAAVVAAGEYVERVVDADMNAAFVWPRFVYGDGVFSSSL